MLNSELAENFPTFSEVLPTLRYVEYHLVEHCNLSCQRCGHFSPLAKPGISDREAFARDLRQLATHFASIKEPRLLGGQLPLQRRPEAPDRSTQHPVPPSYPPRTTHTPARDS